MLNAVQSAPRLLLRLEAAAAFIALCFAYHATGQSWWLFVILFLAPDLSMLAYLANPRIGAIVYNAAHTLLGPFALAAIAVLVDPSPWLAIALIWAAHIAFDRVLGYGLKYASAFGDTHLGHIGKPTPTETLSDG